MLKIKFLFHIQIQLLVSKYKILIRVVWHFVRREIVKNNEASLFLDGVLP